VSAAQSVSGSNELLCSMLRGLFRLLGSFRTDLRLRAIEFCHGGPHLRKDHALLGSCRASDFCGRSQLFSGLPRLFRSPPKHLSSLPVELGAFPARLFLTPCALGGGAHGFDGFAVLFRVNTVSFRSIPPLVGSCMRRGFLHAPSLGARPSKFSLFPARLRGVSGLLGYAAP
jgi:hypothetical protein